MRVLLDTHTLIWTLQFTAKLSRDASHLIGKEESEAMVSIASAWEIAMKFRIGKLPDAARLSTDFIKVLSHTGFILLAIQPEVALRAGKLRGEHRDPFDRIIAAQAPALDVPVLSIDKKLDSFGVRRIW